MTAHKLTSLLDELVADWSRERPDLDIGHKQIVYAVFILQTLLSRSADRILERWDLNFVSLGVIATLRRIGVPHEMAPGELAQVLGITSGGMTNLLHRLEAAGYIKRLPDQRDRRGVRIRLTSRGRSVADRAATAVARSESRHLGTLTAPERRRLLRSLRALIATFATGSAVRARGAQARTRGNASSARARRSPPRPAISPSG